MSLNVSSLVVYVLPLILFSLVSTFLPREYTWIVFIIYTIIVVALMSLVSKIRTKKRIREVKGTMLLRSDEKNTMEVIMRDRELFRELNKQTWGFLIVMFASFLLLFTVVPMLNNLLIPDESLPHLERFIRYLTFYGVMWGIMYGLRIIFMPKKMLIPVTRYEVLSTGIKCGGLWIPFPLDEKRYRINVNHMRGFVEIHDLKLNQVHRLYATDTHKLQSLIEKYGLKR